MNQKIKKNLIIVGTIGLIVLACINWLIVISVLFIAFIVWIASSDINKEESRYASSYFTSKQEVKEAKTPIEYGSSSHQIQLKSYMQDCVRYIATGNRTKSRYNLRMIK